VSDDKLTHHPPGEPRAPPESVSVMSLKGSKPKKQGRKPQPSHNGKASYAAEVPALLPIGHGSYVATDKITAILNPNSSPVKRLVHEAEKAKLLVNATHGRRNRSVLVMDDGHVVLSALNPDVVAARMNSKTEP